MRRWILVAVLGTAVGVGGQDRTPLPGRRLADGKEWMVRNADAVLPGSYCYGNDESNCRKYGRLYLWATAGRACEAAGGGWRLPSDAEWRRLAAAYGGVSADSADKGRGAYAALLMGGASGFDGLLGGGREGAGGYARLEAHGFYWTATEGPRGVIFYNFGRGGLALHRQEEGEKEEAFAVRCVRD